MSGQGSIPERDELGGPRPSGSQRDRWEQAGLRMNPLVQASSKGRQAAIRLGLRRSTFGWRRARVGGSELGWRERAALVAQVRKAPDAEQRRVPTSLARRWRQSARRRGAPGPGVLPGGARGGPRRVCVLSAATVRPREGLTERRAAGSSAAMAERAALAAAWAGTSARSRYRRAPGGLAGTPAPGTLAALRALLSRASPGTRHLPPGLYPWLSQKGGPSTPISSRDPRARGGEMPGNLSGSHAVLSTGCQGPEGTQLF